MIERRRFIFAGASILVSGCARDLAIPSPRFHSNRISVTVHGKGPDVVLLAGADALASQVWSGTITAVPGFRYHVVQIAGFGGVPVGGNAGEGPVVEPIAGEIARYMQEQRLHRPALVGLSMGGSLSLMLAARHPTLVSKVMVLDMVPFMGAFFGGLSASVEALRSQARSIREHMLSMSADERRKNEAVLVDSMVRTPSERAAVLENGIASDPTVYPRVMEELILTDLRPELLNIRVPLTVLYVHAPLIPLSEKETDALYRGSYANLPHAILKRIPESYHFIMLDQPQRFARELQSFLHTRQ